MPYLNLKAEMGRRDVTIESIAQVLDIHRNSVANKLKGDSTFYIDEAIKIRDAFFPDADLSELFKKDESE